MSAPHGPKGKEGLPGEGIPPLPVLPAIWREMANTLRPYSPAAAEAYTRAAEQLDAAIAPTSTGCARLDSPMGRIGEPGIA